MRERGGGGPLTGHCRTQRTTRARAPASRPRAPAACACLAPPLCSCAPGSAPRRWHAALRAGAASGWGAGRAAGIARVRGVRSWAGISLLQLIGAELGLWLQGGRAACAHAAPARPFERTIAAQPTMTRPLPLPLQLALSSSAAPCSRMRGMRCAGGGHEMHERAARAPCAPNATRLLRPLSLRHVVQSAETTRIK